VISARLAPALGSLRIDEITPQRLGRWRAALLDEGAISHRTINKLTMVVGAVLERARRRSLISDNPARRLEKLKEPAYDDLDYYEPDEVWRLVDARPRSRTARSSSCSRSRGCAAAKR